MCDQKLLVPIPDLLTIRDFDPTHPEFGINDAGERCLNLDACIVPAVQALWAAGIVTEACCCGHGEAWGVITVQRQEDPSLRGAVLLRREEYNDLTAAQATIAQRDAQVAELTAALAAFQYVNRPDGMMCWCTPPVVAAHYPAHGWTCNQARKVIAGHIG